MSIYAHVVLHPYLRWEMDSEEERSKDGSLQEKCSFPNLVLKLAQKKIVKFVTKLFFSELFFFSFTVLFE